MALSEENVVINCIWTLGETFDIFNSADINVVVVPDVDIGLVVGVLGFCALSHREQCKMMVMSDECQIESGQSR
jgi:hypothetical protein